MYNYIKHYLDCLTLQIRRYKLYDYFQFIKSLIIFFHILTLDFIFIILLFDENFDCVMIIINKFNKRNIYIFDKFT